MRNKSVFWIAATCIIIMITAAVLTILNDSPSIKAEIKEVIIQGEDIQHKVGIIPTDILRENGENGASTIITEEQAQQIIDENNSHYTTAFSKDYDALWVTHENNLITYYTQYSFENLPVAEIKVGGGCLDVEPLSIEVEDDTATATGTVYTYSIYIDYDNQTELYHIDFSYWETPYTNFNIIKRDGNWVLDAEDHSSEGNRISHTDNLKDHYDTLEEALTAVDNLDIDELNPIK